METFLEDLMKQEIKMANNKLKGLWEYPPQSFFYVYFTTKFTTILREIMPRAGLLYITPPTFIKSCINSILRRQTENLKNFKKHLKIEIVCKISHKTPHKKNT